MLAIALMKSSARVENVAFGNGASRGKKRMGVADVLLATFFLANFFLRMLPVAPIVMNAFVGCIGVMLLFYVAVTE